ncbi:MAG: sensor histidine kinase, partial [Bacteroidota bacterium]|nr:sensor histidine kinase [Bacteroidota bacterium]
MAIKLRKSYKFALRSSLFITVLTTLLFVLFHMDLGHMDWAYASLFALISFIICFTVIQVRVERFIYRRIKKIYDDVTLLES